MSGRIFIGSLHHIRHAPVHHAFTYPTWMLGVDVDDLPDLHRRLRLFGHNRRRPVALHDRDYLGGGDQPLRARLSRWLADGGAPADPARIVLVTSPRVLGHTFNPVSFWYCYGSDGRLESCVAEVNNTFGEGHVYVLGGAERTHARWDLAKEFHVSPFNPPGGRYRFWLPAPGAQLDARIELHREDERILSAWLRADSRPLDDRALLRLLISRPLSTFLTLPRILRQAAALYFGRRMPVVPKPEPASARSYSSSRPPYTRWIGRASGVDRLTRMLAGRAGGARR